VKDVQTREANSGFASFDILDIDDAVVRFVGHKAKKKIFKGSAYM